MAGPTPGECVAALTVAIADVRELVERLEGEGKSDVARTVRRDLMTLQQRRETWKGNR